MILKVKDWPQKQRKLRDLKLHSETRTKDLYPCDLLSGSIQHIFAGVRGR